VTILVLIRKLLKTLNSDGTPGQLAAGIALGAVLGLTPLFSLHNLVVLAAAFLLQVSLPGFFLGWALSVPVGFLLDPLFDWVGRWLLLSQSGLQPLWTAWYNAPVVALTNFNNTIVLGSFIVWLVLLVPVFLLARVGVTKYRAHIYPQLARWKVFQVIKGSKLYNLYRLFRPQ
jgi:uncharacterized protein (TIGR03546 family)